MVDPSPTERQLARQAILLELARLEKAELGPVLKRITELEAATLGVERVSYWSLSETGDAFVCEDLYLRERDAHESGQRLLGRDCPGYLAALAGSRIVAAGDARSDPLTRELRDAYLIPLGISSMLDVPVFRHGRVVGILCHEHVGPSRHWAPEEQDFAASMADILALALEEADRRRLLEEQRRLAAEARQRAAEWEGVVSAIADAVWVVNAEGRATYSNEMARRLHGIGTGPYELFDREGRPVPPADYPVHRALRGETMRGVELLAVRGGARRFIRTSAAPTVDVEGRITGAVIVGSDVTERVELDLLRDQFVAVAAHELKTPVTIVKGYAQAIRDAPPDLPEETRRRMLDAVDRGADRIDKIVQDLLDVTRLQLGLYVLRPARLDLTELVAEVAGYVARASARHRIHVAGVPPVPVHADRDRLVQVLSNLLGNAVRYSPAGGDVEVEVAATGGRALVAVRDHGIGIPADRQGRVFDRFFRAHAGTAHDYGGMGVGLFLTRELVKRHGGEIWFVSREGEGSTFFVALPLDVDGG